MRELIFFLIGFIFALIILSLFVLALKYAGMLGEKSKNNNCAASPGQDKYQKELERQYNNLMNYDGRTQRGADDED